MLIGGGYEYHWHWGVEVRKNIEKAKKKNIKTKDILYFFLLNITYLFLYSLFLFNEQKISPEQISKG
jgi:hypothetical protein